MTNRFKELFAARMGVWIVPFLALGIALILTQTPLFNTLGYEFSLAIGAVLPFFVGLIWLGAGEWSSKAASSALALFIPPFVMLVNLLFVKNCAFIEGLGFYALSAGVGSAFAVSLALFSRSLGTRFSRTVFTLVYALIMLSPVLYRLYASPQIFFFNHIFGFYAGSIYDDAIELESRYILFRVETLLLTGLILVWSNREQLSGRDRLVLTICLVPLVVPLELGSDEFGFTSSHRLIEQTLAPIDDTGDWRMRPDADSLLKANAKRRLESELADLKTRLHLDSLPAIRIYIYPDSETKKRFTGADNTEFTKIWRNEIHITETSFDDVIRHELVHILFGRYGLSGLGISPAIGLVEGIAVAFETADLDWTTHEFAAAVFKHNLAPKRIESLLGGFGFWTGLGATSYTLMGSFVKYLVESYGIEPFKQVYAEISFENTYRKSLSGLIEEWKDFLKTISIPASLDSATLYRFQRKTIFQTECPHTVAVELKKAAKSLSKKNYDESLLRYKRVLKMTNNRNARAVQGYLTTRFFQSTIDSMNNAAVFQEADSLVKFIEKPEPILFTVANAMLWRRFGNRDTIQSLLSRVYQAHLSFNFDYAVMLRLSATQSNLNLRYFYPFLTALERDSLLKSEFQIKSDSATRRLVQFIQSERALAKGEIDSALALMQSTAELANRELEFQRRYDILETLLRLMRFDDAKLAETAALEAAKTFDSPAAKIESIQNLVRLYQARM